MKTPAELVDMLEQDKGILFTLMSKEQAIDYLSEKNNYLRTTSYRKNYTKYDDSVKKISNRGKYQNLEFAYLTELSTIDMMLRNIFLKMSIDIEHAMKVQLIRDSEQNTQDDGYSSVVKYFSQYQALPKKIWKRNMDQNGYPINPFIGNLTLKYFAKNGDTISHTCPIWVLMELLTFKETINFLVNYKTNYCRPDLLLPSENTFNLVRNLRNACAHNNCIFHSLRKNSSTSPPLEIEDYVKNIHKIGRQQRDNKLKVRVLLEIVTLLYIYDEIVPANMKERRYAEIKTYVSGDMCKNIDYFNKNSLVKSSLEFLKNIVDNSLEA